MSSPRSFETSHSLFTWGPDGIVRGVTREKVHTLEQARENVQHLGRLLGGVRAPLIIDSSRVREMPSDVSRYYAGPEAAKNATAIAVVTSGLVGRLIANMTIAVMGLMKSSLPTRLFEDEASASEWARQYVSPGAARQG
jgi:hypothetical protein